MIMAWHRCNDASRRLDAIPDVGPMLTTALVASVADPKACRSGRNFSAWIGVVPKQYSSEGKTRRSVASASKVTPPLTSAIIDTPMTAGWCAVLEIILPLEH